MKVENIIMGDDDTDSIQMMFNHQSKLLKMVDKSIVDAYKNLLMMLKKMQNVSEIPVHPDYLGNNDLAINIYKNKYLSLIHI